MTKVMRKEILLGTQAPNDIFRQQHLSYEGNIPQTLVFLSVLQNIADKRLFDLSIDQTVATALRANYTIYGSLCSLKPHHCQMGMNLCLLVFPVPERITIGCAY